MTEGVASVQLWYWKQCAYHFDFGISSKLCYDYHWLFLILLLIRICIAHCYDVQLLFYSVQLRQSHFTYCDIINVYSGIASPQSFRALGQCKNSMEMVDIGLSFHYLCNWLLSIYATNIRSKGSQQKKKTFGIYVASVDCIHLTLIMIYWRFEDRGEKGVVESRRDDTFPWPFSCHSDF